MKQTRQNAFDSPVTFNDTNLNFPAKWLIDGYTVKLVVTVEDTKVIFEPDEERNWRAVLSFEDMLADKKLDAALLNAIAGVIEVITK